MSGPMTVFDLLNAPLDGSNLIEASAGTGKTHNIVGLFIRLILEKELRVRDILVVTYTIAATDELRHRIRKRLVQTSEALNRGNSADTFISQFIKKIYESKRTDIARRRLRAAIRDFDEASIFTIHSFCLHMLQEHAFESGILFDTELIPDEESILLEFARDFWRRHFYEAPSELVGYGLGKSLSPDTYLRLLKQAGGSTIIDLIPETPPTDMNRIEREIDRLHSLFGQLRRLWQQERKSVSALLHRPGLNGRVYGKQIDTLLDTLDAFFKSERSPFPLVKGFEKITSGKIGKSVNKGHEAPRHRLFDLAQELHEQASALAALFDQHFVFLRREIICQARTELPQRKKQQNILVYDDLLNNLELALRSERGQALAEEIRARFQAVLIDEFQDTDPVQYAIFKSLFLSENQKTLKPFFVIGDPKQAIYAFRGADIFAYIDASRAMQRTCTLNENWRSEPQLLQAVNALFGAANDPFLYDAIRYRPLNAAHVTERNVLRIDGDGEAPFRWWLIPEGTESEVEDTVGAASYQGLARTGLYPRVADSVASECARLIRLGAAGRAKIGSTPLQAGDLAILVRTNREAEIMRTALVKWRIPHVLSSLESVFHSPEANDVRRILTAIADPKNLTLVRAALVTDIMGMSGDDLHDLAEDSARFEEILRRFHLYRALWESRGFIRMFRSFLENEHLPSRILNQAGGERRLTNLLHIGELLHQAAISDHLAMHDLISWLGCQISTTDIQPEEYELRLERDEKAVKIATIHKSKGLEYPVVFCPFSWGSGAPRKNPDHVLFHDPARSFAPVVDFGSPEIDEHRRCAEEEALAEEIRLLYVALTRARHRSYFIWGRLRNAGHSAAAYLFHQGADKPTSDIISAVRKRYAILSPEDFFSDVTSIATSSAGAIQVETLPEASEKPYRPELTVEELSCRDFTGHIDQSWKTASYTFLVSPRFDERTLDEMDQTPQWDMTPAPSESLPERRTASLPITDLFSFPGGTKSGILLHEILEKIDYRQAQSEENRSLIDEKLLQYGYGSQWSPILINMVTKVTTLSLPVPTANASDLTLSNLAPGDRRNEVEFYFPLKKISRDDLARLFRKGANMADSGLSQAPKLHCLERLHFRPLEGYLKGFIDLIFSFEGRFYLADWKSNYLGNRLEDYGQKELIRIMDEGFYYIQYHLYALALHQYLALRVPGYRYEDHFGGVYYLFLRGMDPASGSTSGVFHDRPPLALLEMMREALIRPSGS
ncbi:MAG: exodeoxyribonuclease V subunit beta [Syntrophaceae bacterium]|nr:exodeoxyribonuclease V subunit beta [Syntrophaceae bacterium]